MAELRDRCRATLVALACGDALGATVEFEPRERILKRYPGGFREILGGGPFRVGLGETTDDTAMALCIARGLAESATYNPDAVVREFVDWFHSDPKDIGKTTRHALHLLDDGMAWEQAGTETSRARAEGGAGNGSVMRSAPVALRYQGDPDMLVRVSIETAHMTHADPRCTWAAVAVNQAIVHLLHGGGSAGMLDAARAGIGQPEVLSAIAAVPTLERGEVLAGGYVIETMTAAFWCLLTQPSLEDAIVEAVMLGGDTDTTAAVVGALAGAHWGMDAIPARWRTVLWGEDELVRLADRMLDLASDEAS